MATESNSFEIILKALMDDFGGPEIFSEENYSRLNKALMSLDDSLHKDWLLIANMKHIPQKMYEVMDASEDDKQIVAKKCKRALVALIFNEGLCEVMVFQFIRILWNETSF